MKIIKHINATTARNDFFNLLKKNYLDKQIFLIKKGGIPMSFLIPANAEDLTRGLRLDKSTRQLDKLKTLRNSMAETSDSVSILRKVRLNEV